MVAVHGFVDEGFGPVADAFVENFESRNEVGSAFCLYIDGSPRVDLWAGLANNRTGAPWDERTLALVFSTTKGATAICVAKLVQDGLLSYGDAVAEHWPEFAAAGKSQITVDHVMSHQAGLIGVEDPITFDEIMAVTPVVEALQRQAPEWPPGTAHGYHALTYGWLAGELVAHVDGRRIGRYFADEVAEPLGLDFWIGLPEREEHRVARLRNSPLPTDPAELERLAATVGPGTNVHRAVWLDGRLSLAGDNHFNSREVHATEMPAANGITDARSLARMYGATIGEVDGVRLLDRATMNLARTQRVAGRDLTLVDDTRFGAGFWLHHPSAPMIQDGSFGHPGAGGSLGFANPELGIGYGYVMNQMGGDVTGDPRTVALNDAVLRSL